MSTDAAPDRDNDGSRGDLRKALQHAVCQIIWEQDRQDNTRTTQSAIAALTELTFQYATKSLIPDLYAFSTHAGRKSTISSDDVALALRKLGPDRLEGFKRDFCSGNGNKTTSAKESSFAVGVRNRKHEKMGKIASIPGSRRKSNQTEIQPLLSLSTSSEDEDGYGGSSDKKGIRKQNSLAVSLPRKSSARTSNNNIDTSSPLRNNQRNSIGTTSYRKRSRTSNQTESLLNKFQVPLSRHSGKSSNNRSFEDDSSSTDDDTEVSPLQKPKAMPKIMSPARVTTAAENSTSPALSLQRLQKKRHSKGLSKKSHHCGSRDSLLQQDDDNDSIGDDDDDDDDLSPDEDSPAIQRANARYSNLAIDADTAKNREGSKPQSQVDEALANLSSDSGMDGNESENETDDDMLFEVGKNSSDRGHRPVIESDDDD
eukprot:jgi/Psemu1/28049/gm1.28049_g